MSDPIFVSAIVLNGKDADKKLLNKCLKSLFWCSEVVKVDTSKVKGGFDAWRSDGLKRAKGDWILYVDTDEEVPLKLAGEIKAKIKTNLYQGYAIPRRNFIFGQEFKHGGQYPDYQKRLFLRKNLKFWKGELHEEPVFEGEMGHLKNALIHHKDMTLSEMVEKTNKWSEIESELMFEAGHPKMTFWRFSSAGCREFWLRFILQLGFLDGAKGVIYSLYQVYSRLISYSKLWEKQL